MNSIIETLDAQVAAKHLLTHPFYQAWTRGELSLDALRDYAAQYYHHVAAFPTYLSAVHSHCDDQGVRKQILQNLVDEEAGAPNHPQLWLRFAEGLGLTNGQVHDTAPWPETQNLVSTFRSICRDCSVADGLAALYSYESQIPAVSESKISGLKAHYGMTIAEDYKYFTVHIEADKEHAAAERAMILDTVGANEAEAAAAGDRALDAMWEMLSGVCRRHEIAC